MGQFLQWNPSEANQDPDAVYQTDPLRVNGIATNATFPSPTANKLFYQLSTFVTALAQVMVAKGYTIDDASLSALETNLAGIVTGKDNPTFNLLTAASILSTTGLQSYGGVESGEVGVQVGQFACVDVSLAKRSGFTGTLAQAVAAGASVVGGIIVP